MDFENNSALVLFSGGQDSTTCLGWALERYEKVETLGFQYNQRHAVELSCRQQVLTNLKIKFPQWGRRLSDDHLIDLSVLSEISNTAMTQKIAISIGENGLPNTFVPGRNLMFLTLAASIAYRRGIKNIITGVCETDFSGYPDCRDDTVKALQVALNLGMESRFIIQTPLMWLDKAATWLLAEDIGGHDFIKIITEDTHTCYVGERNKFFDWGYGCGECPACELREKGWNEFVGVSI